MRRIVHALLAAGVACGLLLAQGAKEGKPVPVKGKDQQEKIVKKVPVKYPPEAKAAGIQGPVRLEVVIGKDGAAKEVKVVSGPKELTAAAVDSVKQWQWKPTMIDGKPVAVMTQVDVNFTLSK